MNCIMEAITKLREYDKFIAGMTIKEIINAIESLKCDKKLLKRLKAL